MTSRTVRWPVLALVIGAIPATVLSAEEVSIDRRVGRPVADFTLKDATSTSERFVRLYSFRGKKAVVLVFLGTDCPVGNLYAPRLSELNAAYKDKGVVFLGINSNARETEAEIAAHAREHGLNFPVLKDKNNLAADIMRAERMCEALVIDGRARLVYRGAIDDQYGQGTRKDKAGHQYLRDALDAVLASKPVEVKATPVAGCLIDRAETAPSGPRVRPASAALEAAWEEKEGTATVEVGKVTYAADVAPIVQRKCQSCHRPGQVAPFSLLSYDDARKHAAMIREVVDDRRMPPWHADPRFGHFSNDRSLSARERATLLAWADQGAPLGDPQRLPAPKTFTEGWTIGKPDAVFELPTTQEVPAQGVVDYVHVRVPTNFKEDMWVQAAEAVPGDRGVVHHIIVYVDDHSGRRPGEGHLCGYAPGDMPSVYPPGVAKRVPAGSDLVFQLHYTPNGKARTDRSKVGLVFAKEPVKHEAHTYGIANHLFELKPRGDNQEVISRHLVTTDAHLLSFMPHMHLRGKDFTYKITYPDGRTETLLSVPAYDFGWQSYYNLAEPKALPHGTRIECVAHFDNSAGNPYNPNPEQTVTWGEQTFQEMMIGYIDYVDDAPIDPKAPADKSAPAPIDPGRSLLKAFRSLRSGAAKGGGR
ncbi:MAG: redoxin domain-containing protein [Isosphaeraceae bacterium]|nr:redoxin domain-containing protein [Isosphaeraceae bacterium]